MIAGKWFDPCVGIDIHIVLVPTPAGPVPTPLPHPFVGLIYDPAGLIVGAAIGGAIAAATSSAFKGPVMVNSMPAAHTGTQTTNKMTMPHIPTPPGTAWAGKPPANDGIIVTGSKTVYFSGTNAVRLGDLVMTCGEPIRLPSSTIIAIPMGLPVLVGGPPTLDVMAALFAMIRTQWISEKLHELLGAAEGSWTSKIICFLTGHPVDVVSGMVLTDSVDFRLPGPIPFVFERNYYSRSEYRGPLGRGWHHSYDQFIRVEPKRIVLRHADGRDLYFKPIREGESTRNKCERLRLTRTKNGFQVTTRDNQSLTFGSAGRADGSWPLLMINDLNGNRMTLRYDSGGRLIEVVDTSGRSLQFRNDAQGRLSALNVPHPAGDSRRVDVARFEYDRDGHLVAAHDALGHSFRYGYKHHLLVQETNRNGVSFYFQYDGIDAEARCVRTWGDDGVFDHVLTYDPARRVTVVENSLGEKTAYHANEAGLVEKRVNALGGETRYQWDRHCQKVSETDPLGNKARWEYDGDGNCVLQTDALGQESRARFDTLNRPVEFTDASGGVWRREYDRRGNLIGTIDPLGHRWQFIPDERGRVREVRSPLGSRGRFEFDVRTGLPADMSWEDNHIRYRLDSWGRPIARADAMGRTVDFGYDLHGRLTSVHRPDGTTLRCAYDPQGRLTRVEKNDGRASSVHYVYHGRTVQRIDPLGRVRGYKFDTENRLVQVDNENGRAWRFEYDPAGRLKTETDYAERAIRYQRDAAGQCVSVESSAGKKTEFAYDPLGRKTCAIGADGDEVRLEYDPLGRLVRAVNSSAAISFQRDPLGRVVREQQGENWVESRYDAVGNRTRRRTSLGKEHVFRYDLYSRLAGVEVEPGRAIEFAYNLTGQETARALPGGLRLMSEYDSMGRLSEQTLAAQAGSLAALPSSQRPPGRVLAHRKMRYSGSDTLAGCEDEFWGESQYSSDLAGELAKRDDSGGRDETFGYDNCGNLTLLTTARNGTRETLAGEYASDNRVVRFGATRFEYDAAGFLTRKETATGQNRADIWELRWAGGRLESVQGPDGEVWKYAYDAFGRRVSKMGPRGEERFLWDGDRLCGVTHPGGRTTSWIFRERRAVPLAKIENDRVRSFITDHLGTPREIVDERGTVVWRGRPSTWGEAMETREQQTDCPIRFQGQWRDEESGLTYNWFRYYDSDARRYISPDPIGLLGGTNTYRYVADPINHTDPYGLDERESMLGGALDVLKSFDSRIREVFGQDVQYGIRGSLSTGESYGTGNPFNPNDFDVDAFILDPTLRGSNQWADKAYPNSFEIQELQADIDAELRGLSGFEGMREDPFQFKAWNREPEGATMCGG